MKALHVQAALALVVVASLLVKPASSQCFGVDFSIDRDPALGDAPCAGYVQDESGIRFCGAFDDYAVERACWATNTDSTTHPGSGLDYRNYQCHQNTLDGEGHIGTFTYIIFPLDGLNTIYISGRTCVDPQNGEDCLTSCYPFFTTDTLSGAVCDTAGYFKDFAISCTDRDECADGVVLDCEHPFAEDCPKCKACGPNTHCVNSVGSYVCVCLDGFNEGTPNDAYDLATGCIPSDQCDVPDTCPTTSACRNTIESYLCFCETVGYHWNTATETCDIKECGAAPTDEVDNAVLQDNDDEEHLSDHVYKCDFGYIPGAPAGTPDGSIEIECRGNGDWCHCATPECVKRPCGVPHMDPHACTTKTTGVFGDEITYTCIDGFTVEGVSGDDYEITCLGTGMWETPDARCRDLNECEGTNSCPPNSDCVNTIGSYHCVCHHGYYGDACDPISCGPFPVVANGKLTTNPPPASGHYGVTLTYECDAGYRVAHRFSPDLDEYDFNVVCSMDGRWSPEPIPECIPVPCGDPGDMKYASRSGSTFTYDSVVSYTCMPGYRPSDYDLQDDSTYSTFSITCTLDWLWTDRPACVNINECEELDNPCGGPNQYCIDLVGSYTCSCDTNYRIDPTGKTCIGIPLSVRAITDNPCEVYNAMGFCNSGKCVMDEEYQRPKCECSTGYIGAFCDREKRDLLGDEVAMGVIACCIAGVALILVIVLTCYICSRHHKKRKPNHCHQPAPPVVYKPSPHYVAHHHHQGHRYAPSVWPLGSNHFPF